MLVYGRDSDRDRMELGEAGLGEEAELYPVDSQSFGSSLEEIRQHLCFFQGQSLFS